MARLRTCVRLSQACTSQCIRHRLGVSMWRRRWSRIQCRGVRGQVEELMWKGEEEEEG